MLESCISFSQFNSKEYLESITKADSLFNARDYRNAAIAFSSALNIPGAKPIIGERYNAASSWALANYPDSSFFQLSIIANSGKVNLNDYQNIITDGNFTSLHSDNRWQLFLEKVYKIAENTFLKPQDSTYTQEEKIYGRKDGMAMTLVHLKPRSNSNGKAIIQIISGTWRSSIIYWDPTISLSYLRKGYSVFVVVHGSAPVYSIADAAADIQRAVRFIRYNARIYEIDSNKIGVTGISAGGHLALLCGLLDTPINENTGDPVDRVSGKVQAVACYYPPTDFLNWGIEGRNVTNTDVFKSRGHIFEFRQWNSKKREFSYIIDTILQNKILKDISPLYNVSANDAPVLIIHGDKDQIVPIQQSESLVKKLKELKVPAVLIVKKGGRHGWSLDPAYEKMLIDWFDKYLQ